MRYIAVFRGRGWSVGVTAAVVAALAWCSVTVAVTAYEGPGPVGDAPTAVSPQEAQDAGEDPEANLPYLFAVFAVTWAVFFGYVFVMSRRQNELRREIETLKAALAEQEDTPRSDDG